MYNIKDLGNKDLRLFIEDVEYYTNYFHKLNGRNVRLKNMKRMKNEIRGDIIYYDNEEGSSERYNNISYRVDKLNNILTTWQIFKSFREKIDLSAKKGQLYVSGKPKGKRGKGREPLTEKEEIKCGR
jgi:hypothetical protein